MPYENKDTAFMTIIIALAMKWVFVVHSAKILVRCNHSFSEDKYLRLDSSAQTAVAIKYQLWSWFVAINVRLTNNFVTCPSFQGDPPKIFVNDLLYT